MHGTLGTLLRSLVDPLGTLLNESCTHCQETLEELAPLSSEQQQIADRVVAGHNIFFTGCAGELAPSTMHALADSLLMGLSCLGLALQFITGLLTMLTKYTTCAGTGKSLLLKHILRALPQTSTYVTASTGLAASVLGGTTLNAFAGVKPRTLACTHSHLWHLLCMVSDSQCWRHWISQSPPTMQALGGPMTWRR